VSRVRFAPGALIAVWVLADLRRIAFGARQDVVARRRASCATLHGGRPDAPQA
jgi:hypothetical protein